MSRWYFLFASVLIILWIIAGGFISQASTLIHPYRSKDGFLDRAYWISFSAAFITWFLVVAFVLLLVLAAFGVIALFGSGVGEAATAEAAAAEGAEAAAAEEESTGLDSVSQKIRKSQWLTTIFLGGALSLIFVTGVLSAYCADTLTKSPNFSNDVPELKKAYDNSIIASVICLGSSGVLVIGMVVYHVVEARKKSKEENQETPPEAQPVAPQQPTVAQQIAAPQPAISIAPQQPTVTQQIAAPQQPIVTQRPVITQQISAPQPAISIAPQQRQAAPQRRQAPRPGNQRVPQNYQRPPSPVRRTPVANRPPQRRTRSSSSTSRRRSSSRSPSRSASRRETTSQKLQRLLVKRASEEAYKRIS